MLCLIDKSFNMHKGLPLITTQQFYYVKSLSTSAVSVNVRLQKNLHSEIRLIGKNKMLIFFSICNSSMMYVTILYLLNYLHGQTNGWASEVFTASNAK